MTRWVAMVVLALSAELPAQDPVATPRNPTSISPGRPILPPHDARVWTVSGLAADAADFPGIQEAIGRARDGDIILVRRGNSGQDFTIVGKSLTLISEDGDEGFDDARIVDVSGYVVLHGFTAGTIEVGPCSGTIWIEQSRFSGVYAQDCESIVITRCNSGNFGKTDVVGSNSNVAIWSSDLRGARGAPSIWDDEYCLCSPNECFQYSFCTTCADTTPPGPGEPAVWLTGDSTVFLSGSSLETGPGGDYYCSSMQAAPGPALRASPTTQVVYLDTTFTGSAPVIQGGQTVVDLNRTSGSCELRSPVYRNFDSSVRLSGKPDTQAFVVSSPILRVAPAPLRFGVLVVRLSDSQNLFFGTVPPGGSPIMTSFPVANNLPGEGYVLFNQSMFVEDLGGGMSETVLGAPSVLVQID